MEYNPEDANNCWPAFDSQNKPIEYDAVLKVVEDKTSKVKADGSGGNPMQLWTFEVYHPDGRTQLLKDYVTVPACTFKIKRLAKALGREGEFKAGKFRAREHLGANVTATLAIEEQEGFDDQNKIAGVKAKAAALGRPAYAPRRESVAPGSRPQVADAIGGESQFKEDDIPFAWEGRHAQPL